MKRFILITNLCFLVLGLYGCSFGKPSEEAVYINGIMAMIGERINYVQTQSLVAKSPKLDYNLKTTYKFDLTAPNEGLYTAEVTQEQNGHSSMVDYLSGILMGDRIRTYHARNRVPEYFDTVISDSGSDSSISVQGSMTKESVEYEECKACEVYKTKPIGTTSAENIFTMFEPALTAFGMTKNDLTRNFRKIGILFYVEPGNRWLYQMKIDFLSIAKEVVDEDIYGPLTDFYGTTTYSDFDEVEISISNVSRAGAIPAFDLFDPVIPKTVPDQTQIGSSLDYLVTDAQFDSASGKLFFIDYGRKKLYSLDTAEDELNSLTFPYEPSALFLREDLIYLAFQTSGSSNLDSKSQSGMIYELNSDSLETVKSFEVKLDPLDLVVTNDGVIVASSATGRSSLLCSYDAEGKWAFSYYVNPGEELAYSSYSNRVYGMSKAVSPTSVTAFSYGTNGKPQESSYDPPFFIGLSLGESQSISPDGNYFFDSRGLIAKIDEDSESDLIYFGNCGSPFTAIAFDLDNDRYFLAYNGTIMEVRFSDFQVQSYFDVSSSVDYLFYKDDFLFAIQKSGGDESIIMKYDLHEEETTHSFWDFFR